MEITGLNHKVLDDAVEEQRVIYMHSHQFQEIVTVLGSLIKESNSDVALCCFQHYFRPLLGPGPHSQQQDGKQRIDSIHLSNKRLKVGTNHDNPSLPLLVRQIISSLLS